ncbi:hypothetical protein, partial [Neptuniibacter sp.]|uniref:hypothetical protein n=1 Tax=Neptuniibacter sp. TaxID=1962643 RepID=UPI00262DABC1
HLLIKMAKLKDMASSNQKKNACLGKILIFILLLIASSFTSVYAQCPITISGVSARDTICVSDVSYTFEGITVSTGTIQWKTNQQIGQFLLGNTANPTYYPGPGESGDVVLTITVSSTSCTDVSEQMILFIQPEPSVDAGGDTTICWGGQGSDVYIEGANTSLPNNVIWMREGTGDFNSKFLVNPRYFPSTNDYDNGGVTLIMTVTATDPCPGVYADTMEITFIAPPTAGTVYDDTICESDGFYEFTGITAGEGSIEWSGGLGYFSPSQYVENPTYYLGSGESGSVVLTMTVSNAPCTADSDDMTLTIQPEPFVYAGGSNIDVCQGSNVFLEDANKSDLSTVFWTHDGYGDFDDETKVKPIYYPDAQDYNIGSVTLTVTATAIDPCSGSYTDDIDVTFIAPPTAYELENAAICESKTSYAFSGITVSEGSIEWTTGGSGYFTGKTTANPTYYPNGELGDVDLTMTVSNAPCADYSDVMTLSIQPEPFVYAGDHIYDVCQGSDVYIPNASENYTDGITWTTTSGSGSFSGTEHRIDPTYTPSATDYLIGSVILKITGEALTPCSESESDAMVVTFIAPPTADAGIDATICGGDIYKISTSSYTNGDIFWTSNGNGTFDDDEARFPIYTPGSDDITNRSVILTLTVTPTNSLCSGYSEAKDVMTLTIADISLNPENVYAGVDATLCGNGGYYLEYATAENSPTLVWTTSSATGYFSHINRLNPVYYPGPADIGDVTLKLTATGCSGAETSDQMILTVDPLPTISLSTTGIICETEMFYITPTVGNASSVLWASNTNGSPGTFTPLTTASTTYDPSDTEIAIGSVRLTLTAYGDQTTGCDNTATQSIYLTIIGEPVIDAGADEVICESGFTVSGVSEDPTTYSTILWTSSGSSGTLTDATSLTPTYTPSTTDISNGFVYLRMTAQPVSPCSTAATDSIRVTISKAPIVDAGQDATRCEGIDYLIPGAWASNSNDLLWTATTGSGTFENPDKADATYKPVSEDIELGHVILKLTAQPTSGSPCSEVSDETTLYLQKLPTVSTGASTAYICEGYTYTTDHATVSDNENNITVWSRDGDGNFGDDSQVNTTYTPGIEDITNGSVTLTLAAPSISPCSDTVFDEITLIIDQIPTADAGPSLDTICKTGFYKTT